MPERLAGLFGGQIGQRQAGHALGGVQCLEVLLRLDQQRLQLLVLLVQLIVKGSDLVLILGQQAGGVLCQGVDG